MTTIDEPRLSELVREYERLGLDVHLEPVHPDEEPGCVACLYAQETSVRTIYVRGSASRDSSDTELFDDPE